jgi:deoxyadenosine/deoxycytidine kinase
MDEPARGGKLIGIVGPCGSGKSTLIAGLEKAGYKCRHIAQEHSYVPYMWQRITNPDVLIFLEASFPTCTRRRQLNWTQADYEEQIHRLSHAHQNAHLVIATDDLSPADVLQAALTFLSGS